MGTEPPRTRPRRGNGRRPHKKKHETKATHARRAAVAEARAPHPGQNETRVLAPALNARADTP
eukprot:4361547-Lingulodinium_polyedra.AAC.1